MARIAHYRTWSELSQRLHGPAANELSDSTDFFHEPLHVHDRAMHGSRADRLLLVSRGHAVDEKPSVDSLQNSFGNNGFADPGRRSVFDVDGGPNRGFAIFAVRLLGQITGTLHPADHPWSRKNGRQLRVEACEGMFVLDYMRKFSPRANGDVFAHANSDKTLDYTGVGEWCAIAQLA